MERLHSTKASELAHTQPLAPIVLDALGNCLGEMPPEKLFLRHTRANDPIPALNRALVKSGAGGEKQIGIHLFCGGPFFRRGATATSDAAYCKICGYRFYIPLAAATYGDLEKHAAESRARVIATQASLMMLHPEHNA